MIPAPWLIIIVPVIAAIPAYFLRRWRVIEVLIAALACVFVITLLSRPVDTPIRLVGFTIDMMTPVNVLGRVLAVRVSENLPLLLLFSAALVLFLLGLTVAQGWTFVPLGLCILAFVSAGLMIRPFVYAALAFEAAAAIAAIMIQAERNGKDSARGALRYLIISTLALPAFLGAGYAVTQAGGITDPTLLAVAYSPAGILLGIGLVLLIGALPIFTWAHSVAVDAPPLTTAFLATIGTGAVTFLFLTLKEDYSWFAGSTDVASLCNLFGIASILFGGVLGWAQGSFGRVMACGLCVEIGSTLLLMNHSNSFSVEAVAFGIVARTLSLGLLGVGIGIIRERAGSDNFRQIKGLGKQQLWATLAIAVGGLSLAGLPGTVGFVSRWTTARVIGQTDLEMLAVTLIAGASVGAGIIRGLTVMFEPASIIADEHPIGSGMHKRPQTFTIALAVAVLIATGIAPGVTAPVTRAIAENYSFYR